MRFEVMVDDRIVGEARTKKAAQRAAERYLQPPNTAGVRIRIWDKNERKYVTQNFGGRQHDFGRGHALPSDHPGAP